MSPLPKGIDPAELVLGESQETLHFSKDDSQGSGSISCAEAPQTTTAENSAVKARSLTPCKKELGDSKNLTK
jgi:hypothetical protein